jgi:two-component system, chemotaxis family, chemotaxis protein CheY
MKILITDDDLVSSRLIQVILLPYGKCEMAVNGKEAFAAVELSYQENKPYDLICLDIEMPEMDGHETLQLIRNLEEKLGVPLKERIRVIMITSARDAKNVVTAKARCNSYLVKPISKERLLEEVARLNFAT